MLAFDIETMGLQHHQPITMICAYDERADFQKSWRVLECVNPGSGEITDENKFQEMRNDLLQTFDAAETLCAYNGVDFDLPFIAAQFQVDEYRLQQWICKTVDIFYTVKTVMNKYYKMDVLLRLNGLQQKCANGLQAIEWARQ